VIQSLFEVILIKPDLKRRLHTHAAFVAANTHRLAYARRRPLAASRSPGASLLPRHLLRGLWDRCRALGGLGVACHVSLSESSRSAPTRPPQRINVHIAAFDSGADRGREAVRTCS